jgi:hypothetical protein
VKDLKRRDDFRYADVDGRIILKWVFSTWGCRLDSYDSEQRPVTGPCEYGNRFRGFIIGRECHSYWSNYEFLKMNFVPRVIRTKQFKLTCNGDAVFVCQHFFFSQGPVQGCVCISRQFGFREHIKTCRSSWILMHVSYNSFVWNAMWNNYLYVYILSTIHNFYMTKNRGSKIYSFYVQLSTKRTFSKQQRKTNSICVVCDVLSGIALGFAPGPALPTRRSPKFGGRGSQKFWTIFTNSSEDLTASISRC